MKYGFSKNSISTILFCILIFSTISAYLTGRLFDLDASYILKEFYISSLLFVLFLSWKNYSGLKGYDFSDININKLRKVEKPVIFINSVIFIIDAFIFAAIFALMTSGVIDVQEHKNDGGAAAVFASLVPGYLITLSYLFSPLGYLSLVLHFYYLINGKILRSVVNLLLSLDVVLIGLIQLSRSALVYYIITYIIIFLFLTPIIGKKYLSRISTFVVIVGIVVMFVFSSISESRFGEKYVIESESLIDEKEYPQLVSILDYFSQWEYYGPVMMDKYEFGKIYWGMYNSCGLGVLIAQKIYGAEKLNAERDKMFWKTMGDDVTAFHGNIARCIFDFGYIGTFLFVLLNCHFTRKWGPDKKKKIHFYTLLSLPMTLPFSVHFFAGNAYSELYLNLAMIYLFVIYKFCKEKNGKAIC